MTVPLKKNWGDAVDNKNPLLARQLDESYTSLATAMGRKTSVYATKGTDAPASAQVNQTLSIGDFYVREDTNTAWIMTSRTSPQNVTWKQIT